MSRNEASGISGPVAIRLQAMVKRVRGIIIRRGILATVAALFGTTLMVMGVQLLMPRINEPLRWVLSSLIPIVAACAFWRYLIRPLRRPLTLERMARIVETKHPELQERLSSTVELAALGEGNVMVSKQLLEALARESATEVGRLTPQKEFSFALVKRWIIFPMICLGILALSMTLWPKGTLRLFVRSVAPSAELGNLYAGRMEVRPGTVRMAAGDSLTVEMVTTDPALKPVYLECRTDKGSTEERMALVTETNEATLRYSLTLPEVSEPFTYRVSAGYAESDRYEVRVETRPALSNLMVRYRLPAYTGLDTVTETNAAGLLRAIAGTEIVLEALPTKTLSNMTMRIGSRAVVAGRILGGVGIPPYQWRFNLATNMAGPYTLEMVDTWGFSGEPVSGLIEVTPDEAPTVRIIAPESESVKVKPTELVKLVAAAHDDFGIAKAELRVSVDSDPAVSMPVDGIQPLQGQPGARLVECAVDLSSMKLAGRRQVKVVVRVYDGRTPEFGGAQQADSTPLVIELDQSAESLVRQALEAQQEAVQEQVKELATAIQEAAALANEVDKQFEDAKQPPTPEAMATVDQAREKVAEAEKLAQNLANAVENTPMAAMKPALDKMLANNLSPARQAADTLPLAETAKQAELANQMEQAMNAAAENADALAKGLDDLNKKVDALATLAELANRQQQLASTANAAANKAPDQEMSSGFKKAEAAVADALAPLAGENPEVPAAAKAAGEAAQAPSAKEAAPAAQKAAEALSKAVNAMAGEMMAGAKPEGQGEQGKDQQQGQAQNQSQQGKSQDQGKPQQGKSQSMGSKPEQGKEGQGMKSMLDPSALASKGFLGYGGGATLDWTKAKGMARSKVGGDAGLRVPPEYREIVGRYFEELSRAGDRTPVSKPGSN